MRPLSGLNLDGPGLRDLYYSTYFEDDFLHYTYVSNIAQNVYTAALYKHFKEEIFKAWQRSDLQCNRLWWKSASFMYDL
jgi:hypothetical protein